MGSDGRSQFFGTDNDRKVAKTRQIPGPKKIAVPFPIPHIPRCPRCERSERGLTVRLGVLAYVEVTL